MIKSLSILSLLKLIFLFICVMLPIGVLSMSNADEIVPIAEATSPVHTTHPSLPTGILGQMYSIQLELAGGKAPFKFEYRFPPPHYSPGCAGLHFSKTGLIHGKPAHEGRCLFYVHVIDSSSPPKQSRRQKYFFKVLPKIEKSLTKPPSSSIERSISK